MLFLLFSRLGLLRVIRGCVWTATARAAFSLCAVLTPLRCYTAFVVVVLRAAITTLRCFRLSRSYVRSLVRARGGGVCWCAYFEHLCLLVRRNTKKTFIVGLDGKWKCCGAVPPVRLNAKQTQQTVLTEPPKITKQQSNTQEYRFA